MTEADVQALVDRHTEAASGAFSANRASMLLLNLALDK
jgi:hypothetical protein